METVILVCESEDWRGDLVTEKMEVSEALLNKKIEECEEYRSVSNTNYMSTCFEEACAKIFGISVLNATYSREF